jgi:hypothetical protein
MSMLCRYNVDVTALLAWAYRESAMSQPSAVRWTAPPPQTQGFKFVAVGDNTVGKVRAF